MHHRAMATPESEASSPAATDLESVRDALRAEAGAIQAVVERLSVDAESWLGAIGLLADCQGHVVFSGMGKSGLVGAKLSATFSSLGQPSHVVHPADAVHGDLGSIRRNDVVILMSYSGTTEEVINLAAILRTDEIPSIGISTDNDSPLAGLCDVHLAIGRLTEACPLNLAPTASTTATMAIGDALALAVSRRRNFSSDDFHKHHPGGMLGVGLRAITEVLRFHVGKNLPVVSDTATVRAALAEARPSEGRRAGAILLVDADGKLTGIFTDGDLRRLVIDDEQAMDRVVGAVATSNPRRLPLTALVRDARQLIAEHRVDEIPVVDEDHRPIGLVDVQDLVTLKVVSE